MQLASAPPGYLLGAAPFDPARVLAGPPAAGSAALAADRAAYVQSAAGVGGKAWRTALTQLRLRDPVLLAPQIACALAAPVDRGNAPLLFAMLVKLRADIDPAVDAAKDRWQRTRPFVGETAPKVCDPRAREPSGTGRLSYPSGHGAIGALWGEVLAAAAPDRAAAARAWGRSLGDNRIACRVHWSSDVAAGQALGQGVFARVAATPAFRSDIVQAQAEVRAARRRQDGAPLANCA